MVTWWRDRRRRLAAERQDWEENPRLPMLVPPTRYALEAQLIARGIHKDTAVECAKQAMDEFVKKPRTEASMTGLRDRVHELGDQRRHERAPGW